MNLTQQQAHSAMHPNTLLHGKTMFVIPTTDWDHVILLLFTQNIGTYFCGHVLLIEHRDLVLTVHFSEFLIASGREGDIQLYLDCEGCFLLDGTQAYNKHSKEKWPFIFCGYFCHI